MLSICVSNAGVLRNSNVMKELTSVIKPGMKVVCIPLASDPEWFCKPLNPDLRPEGKFFEDHYRPFYEYGIELGDFSMITPEDTLEYAKMKIRRSDIIYFSGGRMENLLVGLRFLELDELIQSIASDKIIVGESAGAIVLGDKYYEYPYQDEYSDYAVQCGLGLLPRMRIVAHYSDEMDMEPLVDLRSTEDEDAILVGLTDEEVMIVYGEDLARVIDSASGEIYKFLVRVD